MNSRKCLLALVLCSIGAWATAGTIEKKYPDGVLKVRYKINDVGDRNGPYEEFFPTGKTKVKAAYQADKLDGPYQTFHDNGKPCVSATYKDGKLSGAFTELTVAGQKKLTATYKDGKLDGAFTRFDKGVPILKLAFKGGALVHARSLDEMKKQFAAILGAPVKEGADAEREAALRRLKLYRYLVEVPYEDLVIDDEMNKTAQAATLVCDKLKRLDHTPPNPGVPEADYKLAVIGAKKSNLAFSRVPRTDTSVDMWMFDSDDKNIQHVGHRRWTINPAMQKVGFGRTGNYSAMWAHDSSRKKVPDYDAVCFPPRGLMPVELFGPAYAWSVVLNPRKYKPPTDAVKVAVTPLDVATASGEPLKLNFQKTNNGGFAGGAAVIFRPDQLAVAPGKSYLVAIDGLIRSDNKPAPRLMYVVEFASFK